MKNFHEKFAPVVQQERGTDEKRSLPEQASFLIHNKTVHLISTMKELKPNYVVWKHGDVQLVIVP